MASGILAMISTLLVFIQRIQFMFATDNPISFIQRGLRFPFFGFDWSNPTILFGNGPGSYGQERKLVFEIDDSVNQLDGYIDSSMGLEVWFCILNSGLRIIMELGIIGLIGYSVLIFYFLDGTT